MSTVPAIILFGVTILLIMRLLYKKSQNKALTLYRELAVLTFLAFLFIIVGGFIIN
ncbi:MAG: hypothetical protein HYV32_03975 [Candidatus Kerfeldbacteria bacterium]|nr:hypothetical protein [Candidatus Kerfeldbacteria bacterium]